MRFLPKTSGSGFGVTGISGDTFYLPSAFKYNGFTVNVFHSHYLGRIGSITIMLDDDTDFMATNAVGKITFFKKIVLHQGDCYQFLAMPAVGNNKDRIVWLPMKLNSSSLIDTEK